MNSMKKIVVSKRIELIASRIESSDIIADIGSDHGYLPIYLMQNKTISKAYAIENKKGPYSNLCNNVNNYGYKSSIECILGDGIRPITNGVNTLVIAGMGGQVIKSILDNDKEKLKFIKKIILDCHSQQELVRDFMQNHGFNIVEEEVVKEKDIFYIVMVYKKEDVVKLDKYELILGKCLFMNYNDLTAQLYDSYMNRVKIKMLHEVDEEKLTFMKGLQQKVKEYNDKKTIN